MFNGSYRKSQTHYQSQFSFSDYNSPKKNSFIPEHKFQLSDFSYLPKFLHENFFPRKKSPFFVQHFFCITITHQMLSCPLGIKLKKTFHIVQHSFFSDDINRLENIICLTSSKCWVSFLFNLTRSLNENLFVKKLVGPSSRL